MKAHVGLLLSAMLGAAGCATTGAHFQVSQQGTVLDAGSHLEWAPDPGEDMTSADAGEYARNLSLGGHNDWRLPTRAELARLHDPKARSSPAIPAAFQLGYEMVWTSELTTCRGAQTRWAVYFGEGDPTVYGCGEMQGGGYYDRPPGRVARVLAVRGAR